MPIAMPQLQALMNGENLRYWIHPEQPSIMFNYQARNGLYHIMISLRNDGTALQVRTIGYMNCPANSPHLAAVLKVLAAVNYGWSFVKFSWDQGDGEICATGDVYVMDGVITQQQFSRVLGVFIPSIDYHGPRISTAIATGNDPGDPGAAPPGGSGVTSL